MPRLIHKATFICLTGLFGAVVSASAGPKGQAIEFSEPRNERGVTNSQGMMPGRSRLDRMEAELNGPLKTILKGNSLEGMIMPAPQMVPPPSLQPRNRDNSRRDQMYQAPEDLYSVKSIEDVYKAQELTPDGRRVKDLRPMEKWMRQALGEGQGTNRSGGFFDGSTMQGNNEGLPGNQVLNPADNLLKKELKKIFKLDSTPVSRDRGMMDVPAGDFDASSSMKLSPEAILRREQFVQSLDPNYVPAPAGSSRGGSGFSTPYVNSSFYDPPKVAPAVLVPVVSSTPGASATQPDLWKSSFVQPPPVAKSEPPAAPVSPFMNSPRRGF